MERKSFMRNLGDVLLCISIVLICINCIVTAVRCEKLEHDMEHTKTQIDYIISTEEELKDSIDTSASRTDAQFKSIDERLDEYQGDIDELNKSVDELKPTEEETEEVTEEDSANDTKAESVNQSVAEPAEETNDEGSPAPVEETVEEVQEVAVEESSDDGGSYIGTFQLTAYCATGNPCADGAYPQVGYTAACNDSRLWHRWVYIEGWGNVYIHDTGGMSSNVIDIFVGSYDEAIQFGRRSANVYYCD